MCVHVCVLEEGEENFCKKSFHFLFRNVFILACSGELIFEIPILRNKGSIIL